MKTLKDVVLAIKEAKTVLICGKESSGKTQAVKEIVRDLSLTDTILVLSNHKEIQCSAFKPENVDGLYKPKDCSIVGLEYLDTPNDFIFIDEFCENMDEIINNIDKTVVFVKTVKDEDLTTYLKTFDLVVEVSKDSMGTALFLNILNK